MAFIPVDHVQSGMILASEVTDRRGRLLIPSGRELGPKHVQALKMWGISRIEIEGDDPGGDTASEFSPEVLEAARLRVDDRLRNLPEDEPFRGILADILLPRVAEALRVGGVPDEAPTRADRGSVAGEAHHV